MENSRQLDVKRTWSTACNSAVNAILLSQQDKVAVVTPTAVHLSDGPPSFTPCHELPSPAAGLTAAAWSHKGTDLMAGSADGFLKWWQVDSGEEVCSTQFPVTEGHQDLAISEVACSESGFVAALSGRLLGIFGPGGEHLHTLDAGSDGPLRHVAWLSESSVVCCCGSSATIWHVDREHSEVVRVFGSNPAGAISQLTASPDGQYLAAACENCTVQVWDTRQEEGSADPVLCISDGIEALPTSLSWDASGKLLAAAIGGEVLVWDVSAAKEGKADTSYVCIGFERGTSVSHVSFEPGGTHLAAAADNGLCLIFDSAIFGSSSVASGLVTHIAAFRLANASGDATPVPTGNASAAEEQGAGADGAATAANGTSGDDDGAITAIVWHSKGSLLLGSSTGVAGAAQLQRTDAQQSVSDDSGDAEAVAKTQESAPKSRSSPQSGAANGAGSSGPTKGSGAAAPARGGPAGWGGEPLPTNGISGTSGSDTSDTIPIGMGMGGRGRGGRGNMRGGGGGGRYGMHPYGMGYAKRDGMPGGGAGGAPKPGGPMGSMSPGPAGQVSMSPDQAQMMQAAVAAQWGMMPAAMAPQMWRQMGYGVPPYGQMMMPQMAGMAPGMPGYPAAMPAMPGLAMAAGSAMVPQGVPPQQTRSAPYGQRPGMAGPMGGRASSGGRGGTSYGESGGEGARGAMNGGGYRSSGMGSSAGSERPGRRDGPAGMEQHGGSADQSAQQEQSSRGPAAAAGMRPSTYSGIRGSGGASSNGGAGDGTSSSCGATSSAGEHWQGTSSASSSTGYRSSHHEQDGSHAHLHSQQMYMQASPAGAMQAQGPMGAVPGPGAAMMARSPYGMAPVYMFPQAGVMPGWGMYPGQMAGQMYPTPGGYMMMYPAAAAGAGAAYSPGHAQHGTPPQVPRGGGDGARKDGATGAPRSSATGAGGGRQLYGSYEEGSEGGYPAGGGYPRTSAGGGAYSQGGQGGGMQQGPLMTLYVGNLAPTVDEAALAAEFEQFGTLERVQVIRDRETREAKGYGFVTFSTANPQAAQDAMTRLNGAMLQGPFSGRTIRVSPSNKWRSSDGGGGGSGGGPVSGAGSVQAGVAGGMQMMGPMVAMQQGMGMPGR